MRGKIRWCCRPRCFQWTGKLNPCKPLLRCMHSRYCFCGPEHGLSHSSGVPCAPRQEDARPARPALPKFAVVRYKPDGDRVSSLAVLVYRLVCQPVTLESWVRLPDAALDDFDRAPALKSGRHKHRQTVGKHARIPFWIGLQSSLDCGRTRPIDFLALPCRFFVHTRRKSTRGVR